MPSQNRLSLTRALADHDQRDASTLVAEQLSDLITASQTWPEGKDTAMVDATGGAVTVTLDEGTDENVGLHFALVKTDASANAATLAAPSGQTFEDGAGTIAVADQHGRVSVYWDGSLWRRAAATGTVVASSVTTEDLEATGDVDLSGADDITVPPTYRLPRVWTSGNVTQADFISGASQSINLPAGADGAFPANVEVVSAHIELMSTVVNGDAVNTSALTASLGIAAATAGYLAAGANLIGQTGKRENAAGTLLGSRRAADTPQLTLTATGNAPDVAHITTFAARAVITYWPVA